MALKDLINPSDEFKRIVNEFLRDTLHNGSQEAYNYAMLDFYEGYLLMKGIAGRHKEMSKALHKFYEDHPNEKPKKSITIKAEPETLEYMKDSPQYFAWSDGAINNVITFLETKQLHPSLLSDMWLLWCALYYRINAGAYQEKYKGRDNIQLKDYKQLENEIIPFLGYLFDKDGEEVKRGGYKLPVGKGLEISFTTQDKRKKIKLDGHLAEVMIDDLRKSSLALLKAWNSLQGKKEERKNLFRKGWSDSAKFVFKTMQFMNILDADKEEKYNATHLTFIWDLLELLNVPLKEHYEHTYYKPDAIKELMK